MKRVVTMQDLSCLGKCSLTVAHPTICAMGVECAVLPTFLLSSHTAFQSPSAVDLTGVIRGFLDHWNRIHAEFDGILTGYLANEDQAKLARELITRFGHNARVIHDPAMADHGRLYHGIGPEMAAAHRRLCAGADLVLPNLTEGCMLAGMEYENRTDLDFCRRIAAQLRKAGAKAVLLTGYSPAPDTVGFYFTDGATEFAHAGPKLPRACHGTGDLFSAVVTGGLMRGMTVPEAGRLAADFVHRAIANSGKDPRFGVAFEEELGWLAAQCSLSHAEC